MPEVTVYKHKKAETDSAKGINIRFLPEKLLNVKKSINTSSKMKKYTNIILISD